MNQPPHHPLDPHAPRPASTAPQPTQEPMPVIAQPEPEKDLYTWQAPSRPFKKRNREFYTTILALVILLSIILMFAKEFLLIAVIMAFGFFAYVLASVEPETISHRLTNRGIRTAGKLYHWNSVSRYWWEDKWGQQLLHLELPGQFPGKLLLLQGQGNQKEIEAILKKYSVEDKPDPTWLDKSAAWLQEKVPLESS